MLKKANEEEIKKEIESYGYTMMSYNSAKSVEIKDSDGFMYDIPINSLRLGHKPRMLYHNPYSCYNLNRYIEQHSDGAVHLVSEEYINIKTKVGVLCDKHIDKGIQWVTPNSIIHSHQFCKYCGRERANKDRRDSDENIIKLCKQNDITVLDIYLSDGTTMVKFVCDKHKDRGPQIKQWWRMKRYAHMCTYCSGRGMTTEEYIDAVRSIHPDIDILSEYRGYDGRVSCRCNICGYEWETRAGQLKDKKRLRGCPICGRRHTGDVRRLTQDEAAEALKNVNDNYTLISKYTRYHDFAKFHCSIHNTDFVATFSNVLSGIANCPECSRGRGKTELSVIDELKDFGFNVIPHHKFADCKYKKALEFDAYIPSHNFVVEYDGEQHFMPVDHFASSHEEAVKKLQITQARDTTKDRYCADNGITMIRIPYWERKNVHDFLLSSFSEHNIVVPEPERLTGIYSNVNT